jgi:hypothetical protein
MTEAEWRRAVEAPMQQAEEKCPTCQVALQLAPIGHGSMRDAEGRRAGGVAWQVGACPACGRRFRRQILPRGDEGWREFRQ